MRYDPSQTSPDAIRLAVNETGFRVTDLTMVQESLSLKSASSLNQVELSIKGMTCTGCEQHVNHALNQLDGVLEVYASFEAGNAIVRFDDSKISTEQIVAAVDETGYQVTKVK